MAQYEERIVKDRVEILASGYIQIREAKQVVKINDDGTEDLIAQTYQRSVIDADDKSVDALISDIKSKAMANRIASKSQGE